MKKNFRRRVQHLFNLDTGHLPFLRSKYIIYYIQYFVCDTYYIIIAVYSV